MSKLLMAGVLTLLICVIAISCDMAGDGSHQTHENVQRITTAEHFDAVVLRSDVPVLVDFFADWCGPCRRLAPIIHDLAAEYKGRAIFVKVDVDQAGTLAARYKVSGIPDVRIFREGKPVAKIIGLNKPGKYRAALDAAIVANNGKETKE